MTLLHVAQPVTFSLSPAPGPRAKAKGPISPVPNARRGTCRPTATALRSLSRTRPQRFSSLRSLFTNWQWLAGFVLGLGGWGLYIIALRFAPLSLVQATSAGGVGLLALLVRLGGRSLSRSERVAVATSVGALVLLGLSLPAGTAHAHALTWQAPLGWALASILLAGVAAAPGAAVLRPGAGLAIAAGLLYSAGDVATKAAVDGTSPGYLFVGLLLVCHGLGFVSLQLALQRGAALATAGVSTLLTNVLPILAGLTVFSESMPGGAAGLLRGLGFAGAILGATLLAVTGHAGSISPDEQAGASPSHRCLAQLLRALHGWAGNSPARAGR